jgi:hypothetical protein
MDRPATLRWLAGAAVCLAVFWGMTHYVDRLRRLYLVWGGIVAAFFLNTTIAVVQLVSRSGGLYGVLVPGKGPVWAPSVDDLLSTPNAAVLRSLGEPRPGHPAWATLVPDQPFLVGTLMGGPGAYLALGAIGMPLALALALQMMAPRGSREGLRARLAQSGQGSLVILVAILLVVSAVVVGLLAGPLLGLPFALALVVVGVPVAWPTGLRWTAFGLTALVLLGLGSGIVLGDVLARFPELSPPAVRADLDAAVRVWTDALVIARDFPIAGAGLGSFATIYPFYKSRDETVTVALSSLLQWWVEAGAVGLGLLVLGAGWCLWRLPAAVRRVGTADRSLAFGLIGAAVGFSLFSVVHWTIELAAVAFAASAVGGTGHRWLAGGTDLFVERA